MRRPFLVLPLLAAGLLSACRAGEPPAAPSSPPGTELRNGRWYDGAAFRQKTMYVVGRNLSVARPARVEKVVDLAGGWVVPPYAEAHNHWLEPDAIAAYDAMYLRDGVFYLKDMANARVVRRRMDAALNRPTTVDFVSANEGWTGPGGHPYQIAIQFLKFGSFPKEWTEKDLDRNVVEIVDAPADVEARWPEFLAGRPDFVKVFLLYSEQYAKRRSDPAFLYERGLDPALVPVIAVKAHAAGLRVAAHAYSAADFRNAVAGGADDIGHFPGTGWDPKLGDAAFRITAEDAALAAKRGATVTTTLSWLGERMERDATTGKHILDAVVRPNLELLRRAGVTILIGSDQFRQTPAAEAALLAKWGLLSNAELLKAWCETTPRAIFPKRRIGRLDDGYEASFLVLTGDPLADFANSSRISMRVKQGETLPAPPVVPFPPLKM
jgi:imidazolonepropionase-like amidohydrolase